MEKMIEIPYVSYSGFAVSKIFCCLSPISVLGKVSFLVCGNCEWVNVVGENNVESCLCETDIHTASSRIEGYHSWIYMSSMRFLHGSTLRF